MNKKELILLNSAFLVEGAFEQQTDSIFQWIKDYCCSLNMSEEEIIKIFTSLNDDQVKNIKKTSDYMQYCRTKHYDMLTNNYTKSDNEEVIAVKGDSLLELFGVGEEGASLFSHQKRVAIFEMKANEGYVVPKFVLGVAYHNGIGVDKNEAKALKLLRQASNWGHVLSIIYLCSIDKSYRDNNKNFVYAVLDDTPYKELFYHIYDSDKDVSKSNEYEILKELFSNKAIEDNKYDYVYAKILFNKHITTQDKNALLNGSTRETVAKASVLPMCVKSGAIKFDETVFQNCVNEKEILKSLRNADIRVHDAYKPLCICTDSTYETKKYVDLIKTSYKKDKVEVIDLNKCSPYEFEASCNNVFVTSCSNGENNVVVIVCQGKSTPYEYTKQAKNFACASNRRKFKLLQPAITLNLEGVLPIYICDEYNQNILKENCNVVHIKSTTNDKKEMVYNSIEDKRNCYGIEKISVSDEAFGKIMSLEPDVIDNVLDKVIIGQRDGNSPIDISSEVVEQAIKNQLKNIKCGFN